VDEKAKRRLRSLVTWALTLGVVAAVALAIDLKALGRALAEADWRYLAGALAVTAVGNLVIGPGRWRFILRRLGVRISLARAMFVKVAGAPVKFALPMKSGELFRALYLNRQMGFNLERCVSSVLMEKVATLLAAGIFLFVGLTVGGVHQWRWAAVGATAALLVLFLSRGGQRVIGRGLSRLSGRLGRGFANLVSALAELSLVTKVLILLYSLVFVVTEMAIAFLSFRALGVHDAEGNAVPLQAFLVFIPLSVLSSIPTFSGIGTREAAAAWFFSAAGPFAVAYGTPETRVAAMLLVTVIYYLFVPVVGLPLVRTFLHRSIWKAPEVADGTHDG